MNWACSAEGGEENGTDMVGKRRGRKGMRGRVGKVLGGVWR